MILLSVYAVDGEVIEQPKQSEDVIVEGSQVDVMGWSSMIEPIDYEKGVTKNLEICHLL